VYELQYPFHSRDVSNGKGGRKGDRHPRKIEVMLTMIVPLSAIHIDGQVIEMKVNVSYTSALSEEVLS
jgi:hypothetical protein